MPSIKIQTANNDLHLDKIINVPFFTCFQQRVKLYLHKFHKYFHGLIGTDYLNKLQANIDLANKRLTLSDGFTTKKFILHTYEEKKRANTVIRDEHLDEETRTKLKNLLKEFPEIFKKPENKLSFTTKVLCEIQTTTEDSIYSKSYPYPPEYKKEVEKQISKLLEDGIIQPSRSSYNSPVWIVPKKEDASKEKKYRMVIDYRALNNKTTNDKYPIPEINTMLEQLRDQKLFTTIDLASGFHQIKMHPKDIHKTAFSINNGKYEFLRMPFGLKNAPSVFQRAVDDTLREHIGVRCFVYIDDVIVYGKNVEDHLENLKLVLETLNEANFKIQPDKTEFLQTSVEYLGHVITGDGLKPNPKKIHALDHYKQPETITELRSFLGMSGYYRRFIKDYAKIAKPLTNLLRGRENTTKSNKKEKIEFDQEAKDSFQLLKTILTSDDVLVYPIANKPVILTTDASNIAIGAVISQIQEDGKERPIQFASKALNSTEENYSTIEKEMYAIFWALKIFRSYINLQQLKIYTDHQPLTFALSSRNDNTRLRKWSAYIESYHPEIIYKPGKANVVADALSRCFTLTGTQHSSELSNEMFMQYTHAPLNIFSNQIIFLIGDTVKVETKETFPHKFRRIITTPLDKDKILPLMREYLHPTNINGIMTFMDSLLGIIQELYSEHFWKHTKAKICKTLRNDLITEEEQVRTMKEIHYRAHRGIDENYLVLSQKYYFPKMKSKLVTFINNCQICKKAKWDRHAPHLPVMNTQIPTKPYEIICVDLMRDRDTNIIICIDKFSRFISFRQIENRSGVTIKSKLEELLGDIFVETGELPKIFISDNEFVVSGEIKTYLMSKHMELNTTPNNHSQTNGTCERAIGTLREILGIIRIGEKNKYNHYQEIVTAIQRYNETIHSSTGFTPIDGKKPENLNVVLERLQKSQKLEKEFKELVVPENCYRKYTQFRKTHERFLPIKVVDQTRTTVTTDKGLKYHKDHIKI